MTKKMEKAHKLIDVIFSDLKKYKEKYGENAEFKRKLLIIEGIVAKMNLRLIQAEIYGYKNKKEDRPKGV